MKKLLHNEILQERITLETAKSIKRHPISVMLYDIRSLYNVGSIFRTCDAALVEKIYITGFTPSPPRPEIDKTALGATESVPWEYIKNSLKAIEKIKNDGYKVIALELTDKKRLYSSLNSNDYPCCIVLGNEITGIDDEILALCDDAIEIPMFGVKHSLNVSVAAGIAIFEAVKIYREIEKY
ncbi:MAG: RNA methyltransferase [Bacteroidota bacterium]